MLQIRELTKTFGKFKALNNLSMTVPKGAVYGLVGPNGAGKSTAIRHITGAYRADAGTITLEGLPIYENQAVKSRIGYIPDDIFFFPSASLEEMRRYYRGMYPRFDDALFDKSKPNKDILPIKISLYSCFAKPAIKITNYEINIVDLKTKNYDRKRYMFQLPKRGQMRRFSKGMQKQAAFHLSICTRPDLLVLDEPVDGLDPVMRRQVMSLILSDVAQQGTTVLVSSHNLRELEDVCDHVGIMDHGSMLLERSLADMQGNTVKLQIAGEIPEGLEILHETASGRLKTLVVRGTAADVTARVEAVKPAYYDVLPLSLEEIFIYELGGVNENIKDIIL